jgi:hypothetical protein
MMSLDHRVKYWYVMMFDRRRMFVDAVLAYRSVESCFWMRQIMDGTQRSVRFYQTVLTFDDPFFTSMFPLSFYITGMRIMDSVFELV